jgi:hypothetical protein
MSIVNRSDWLYGQDVTNYHFFKQIITTAKSVNTDVDMAHWEGMTFYRSDHTTLQFSAAIQVSANGEIGSNATFELQLWAYSATDDKYAWRTLKSDTVYATVNGTFFGGTQWNTINLSSYITGGKSPSFTKLQRELWRFRFVCTNSVLYVYSTYSAHVFFAYLTGTTNSPTWETLPTFTANTAPTAANFNSVLHDQDHIKWRLDKPIIPHMYQELQHTQSGSAEKVTSLAFRFHGGGILYVAINIISNSGYIRFYLESFDLPLGNSALPGGGGTRVQIQNTSATSGSNHVVYNLDGRGLINNNWYKIIIETPDTARIQIEDAHIGMGEYSYGDGRTAGIYNNYNEGDQLLATNLTAICNDLTQMHDGPLYQTSYEHELVTYLGGDMDYDNSGTATGPSMFHAYGSKYNLVHTKRWLRYVGSGKLFSPTGHTTINSDLSLTWEPDFSLGLSDRKEDVNGNLDEVTGASVVQLLDLDSVNWLAYGMVYYVEPDNAQGWYFFCQEDYST